MTHVPYQLPSPPQPLPPAPPQAAYPQAPYPAAPPGQLPPGHALAGHAAGRVAAGHVGHMTAGHLPAPVAPVAPAPAGPLRTDAFPPPRPALVPEAEPIRVSVDNNRCHIYGICEQEAPEVFRISQGGSLHYTASVPAELAAQARQAARCCPMQAIAVRGGQTPGGSPGRKRTGPALRSGAGARAGRRRIVVAGGGLAGLSAATRLRERGFDGELVVVGEEPIRPYSRPPLSKQYLAGDLDGDDLAFRADDALDAHWLLDTRVIGLDLRASALELRGGERLPFDGLVVATGVDAKRLPEAPLFSERVRTIRTLADAAAVREAMHAAGAGHVVVIGGGFVGCELACTARLQGMDVSLVSHSGPLLRRVLGERVGQVVGRIQARAGVALHLGREVVDWQDHGDVLRLSLDDGTVLTCDFVVLGLGSVPRVEWLRGSGIDLSDGVGCTPTCHVRDRWGRTLPHIVAAGDVASWPNPRFDEHPRRVEHLIHAVEMGQHAADSLLRGPGRAARFTPVPRFWSEQHGTRIQAVGIPALGTDVEIVEGSLRSGSFVARYTRATRYGDQVVAAVAFDQPLRLLDYRDQIGGARSAARALGRRRRR
ncbi:4Fe-4S single cluster domain-containing protein [Actinacidiphila yanglinensis]|uniref:4Fe-4S single cluster domain-containing protein n=1 Tax=Actinacidiphila yanglinensis TaxID=310779 RepID=A0A1H6E7M9_9ACTN|nr:FAD-dependent oxidoreductase [Actinacidiphila yanglinensis]SEG93253.1 4Fe-4S single cluster domain-containing protein [Actinacidiphila yanglinensis]